MRRKLVPTISKLTKKQPAEHLFTENKMQVNNNTIAPIEISIQVQRKLFSFLSIADYRETVFEKFKAHNVQAHEILLVDAKNRICSNYSHLERANNEYTFPIICYLKIT